MANLPLVFVGLMVGMTLTSVVRRWIALVMETVGMDSQ